MLQMFTDHWALHRCLNLYSRLLSSCNSCVEMKFHEYKSSIIYLNPSLPLVFKLCFLFEEGFTGDEHGKIC